MAAQSLSFQDTRFDVVDRFGQPWLIARQIGHALGYAREDAINKIFERNADEFTTNMSCNVKLTLQGQQREVRVFSLRGAHLLAMFARTAAAKAFRRWVLDVLDSVVSGDVVVNHKTTADERSPLRAAISMLVGKRSLMYPEAYALVHQRFGVEHVDELKPEQLPQAVEYVHRLALEGEYLPRDQVAHPVTVGRTLDDNEAFNLSAVFKRVDAMRELFRVLESPLRAVRSPLAPQVFDGWHEIALPISSLKMLRKHCDEVYAAKTARL